MIQHRTLELLQNPTAIQQEDLSILEKDITKFPYMQSVRALYLYGTHLHKPSAYADLLTRTAAYTTEKKILYQLIQSQYAVCDTPTAVSELQNIGNETKMAGSGLQDMEEIKQETADINQSNEIETQSTKEIIEQNPLGNNEPEVRFEESSDINDKNSTENELTAVRNDETAFGNDKTATENHFPATEIEILTEENEILTTENHFNETETQILANDNEKSLIKNNFNETESVSQLTKIEIKETENDIKNSKSEMLEAENEIQQPNHNLQPATCNLNVSVNNKTDRHQEEMKRLIAEVEAKMAKNRLERQKKQEIAEKEETEILNNDLNFSEAEREIEIKEKAEEKISEKPSETQSNIPAFINTWQSWLKIIDSSQQSAVGGQPLAMSNEPKNENEEEQKAESRKQIADKQHIIDTFIENAPKITKKEKENADFGEKNKDKDEDDISHLMTETLANLYVSQRLYNRAVNAFEILAEKHPERKEYFIERANDVKDMKLGKFNTEE